MLLLIINFILRRRIRQQAMVLCRKHDHDLSRVDDSSSDHFRPVDESLIVDLNMDLFTPLISNKEGELFTPIDETKP